MQTSLPSGVYRLSVSTDSDGLRLDQFLAEAIDDCSRGMARRLIEVGGVHLEGRRVKKCGLVVRSGQGLEVFVDGLPLQPFELLPEHILYQDKHILAINKPAGVAVQPTPARYRGTLYDALQRYLQPHLKKGQKPSIGMVQRLDRDTSGVLVFSIHPAAHKALSHSFREREVVKRYLTLTAGHFAEPEGLYSSQLARRRSTNRTVSVERGGRYAETCYRVLESFEGASLVEVNLVTGRSHQIRAHFSEAGHPLLGDSHYGGPSELPGLKLPRQMLHAITLKFKHPVSGRDLIFTAPLPDDFHAALKHFGARSFEMG